MTSDSKTLIGRDAICKHLGISESLYYKLIEEEGLPVYKKFRRAIANKDLIDEWSKKKLLSQKKKT